MKTTRPGPIRRLYGRIWNRLHWWWHGRPTLTLSIEIDVPNFARLSRVRPDFSGLQQAMAGLAEASRPAAEGVRRLQAAVNETSTSMAALIRAHEERQANRRAAARAIAIETNTYDQRLFLRAYAHNERTAARLELLADVQRIHRDLGLPEPDALVAKPLDTYPYRVAGAAA